MQKLWLFTLVVLCFSCAKICQVPRTEVTLPGGETSSIGESSFPCKHQKKFQLASQYAIEAIFSEEFEQKLTDHIKNGIGEGLHAAAWNGLEAKKIIANMKKQLDYTCAETYGGINGLYLYIFHDNLAFDGGACGPIRFNRIPLRKRKIHDLANTIGHEVAHRVGLIHPSTGDNKFEEPPYIIGNIVKDIVKSRVKGTI